MDVFWIFDKVVHKSCYHYRCGVDSSHSEEQLSRDDIEGTPRSDVVQPGKRILRLRDIWSLGHPKLELGLNDLPGILDEVLQVDELGDEKVNERAHE